MASGAKLTEELRDPLPEKLEGVPDTLRSWWSRVKPEELRNATTTFGRIEVIEQVAQLLKPGEKVLDLGCGPGLLAQTASRRDIKGIDMAPAMIVAAQAWMDDVMPDNILEYFPSDSPDTVVLCNVLESYSAEVRSLLLRHVQQFLSPGGRVIIVIPVSSAAGPKDKGITVDTALDLLFPTAAAVQPDELEDELVMAGFNVNSPELVQIKKSEAGQRLMYAIMVGKKPGSMSALLRDTSTLRSHGDSARKTNA
eukprot:TRINITY_DN54650_c0_g1_i1.p1 TRINITY_DN54650_c0_g1~~TRINITY_DN54650_c0_g1_i1.p1  ORF type:complete len:262 (-),score=53.80 TRINITY_DN54650_c0_g1_i1:15-773(-)